MIGTWIMRRCVFVLAIAGSLAMVAGVAEAQTVSYSLGAEVNLVDPAFYAGGTTLILNFAVNNSGTEGVFWAVDSSNGYSQQLYRVPIGVNQTPVALARSGGFSYQQIVFTPDDSAVYIGGDRYDLASQTSSYANIVTPNGTYPTTDSSVTRLNTNNWRATSTHRGIADNNEVFFVPILPDGTLDTSRDPVIVTNFGFTANPSDPILQVYVAPDASAVTFAVWNDGANPDVSNLYILENLQAILAAPKLSGTDISSLAPTSLADPNIVELRASETPNGAFAPAFSQDGTLMFYSEDFNNVFDSNGSNFFTTAAIADFDINIAQRDGTGDTRLVAAGNQSVLTPFPTGSRLTYIRTFSGLIDFRIYATTIVANNDINTETDPIPGAGTSSTTVNGNPVTVPFVLTANAVATTSPVTVTDPSGTTVDLPQDQVINFPPGPQAITITSVVEPVSQAELPDPATAIPVLRDFGPDGTQFFPPITVTISYTDAEIADVADESAMVPYLYNTGTQTFEPLCAENDTACLSAIVVDTVNNTLSFQTDHFSTYGIGGAEIVGAPQRPWAILVTTIALMAMALIALGASVARMRKQN